MPFADDIVIGHICVLSCNTILQCMYIAHFWHLLQKALVSSPPLLIAMVEIPPCAATPLSASAYSPVHE